MKLREKERNGIIVSVAEDLYLARSATRYLSVPKVAVSFVGSPMKRRA
jgi:hypothetical protein